MRVGKYLRTCYKDVIVNIFHTHKSIHIQKLFLGSCYVILFSNKCQHIKGVTQLVFKLKLSCRSLFNKITECLKFEIKHDH